MTTRTKHTIQGREYVRESDDSNLGIAVIAWFDITKGNYREIYNAEFQEELEHEYECEIIREITPRPTYI